jgi:hypothetical protein
VYWLTFILYSSSTPFCFQSIFPSLPGSEHPRAVIGYLGRFKMNAMRRERRAPLKRRWDRCCRNGPLALILRLPVSSYLVWAMVGSVGAATVLSFTILAEYFPSEIAGQANAALNILHIGGAFVVQYAIGVILEIWGSKDGQYPMIAYQAAFTIILSLQIVAWGWYFSSELVNAQRSRMWNETQRAGR